jgi:short-chain fatty acids transporter
MLRSLTRVCVRYAERYVPNPYLYALVLTFVTMAAALIWTPSSALGILDSWYDGIWSILAFALQMALILSTGIALADAPALRGLLGRLASLPGHQASAAITVFLAAAVGSWLHWGFGLVVGALVARATAERLRDADFGFLVAAGYMGNSVWASGLSSSIALATATHGSALNIVEQMTGQVAGLDRTIFTRFNLIPVVLLLILIPVALYFMGPEPAERKRVDPRVLASQVPPALPAGRERSFASRLENSWIPTVLFVLMGACYEGNRVLHRRFGLDINGFIFIALMLGLILHWRPIRYVRSFESGARTVGPILLQFPLYGGIMGMMSGTGLAGLIAQGFVSFSSGRTLPFWSFISSNIISLFVPSGGGHWAVQGPFMIPAALRLHADVAMTAMGTAMGEQTANMVQPFWALPILAIARLGIKDIMGYCVIALVIGLVVYGGALLVFA